MYNLLPAFPKQERFPGLAACTVFGSVPFLNMYTVGP
jgi:hypothetical protein